MKTRRNNKRPRIRGRRTRSKRQRGSGASCSRPTENIDIDMTDEQLALNDALGTAIVTKDPSRVKQLLDEGAHATITIDDDHGTQHGLPVETIPAIMYVARHVKDPNTIILNHLLNADSNLNVQGGCAVSRMGTTLLSEAAEWSNIDMMRELLNLGADINDASHRPTALSYAVLNQDINMVNFILSERKGQVILGYTHDDVRLNVIDEALEQHENAQDETWPYQDEKEIERTQEIIETLKRYAVKQSIMSVDDFNTKCEKKQESGKPECGILMNELTNKTAVMPHPPMPNTDGSSEANTSVCFDRSALQQHLLNRMDNPNVRPPILTNPITGREISDQDIERMFPLGLDAHYTHESYTKYDVQNGGKSKRKTRRKNKKSRKHGRKTRSKRQKGGTIPSPPPIEYMIDAIEEGEEEQVKDLLEMGADVNATEPSRGNTPLIEASASKLPNIVKILLDNGADVNATNNDNSTALMEAINCNWVDPEFGTPWNVVENGITSIMNMLLAAGADVNMVNNDGKTALRIAKETGCTNIIKVPLKGHSVAQFIVPRHLKRQEEQRQKWIDRKNLNASMAQFHVKKPYGHPRMHTDITRQIGDYLSKKPNDKSPAAGGKRRTRKYKKSNKKIRKTRSKRQRGGADEQELEQRDDNIIRLSSFNDEDVRKVIANLLEEGVSPVAKNTALHVASRNGHTEIVEMLLEKGADVNAKTNEGITALIRASEKGHTETVARLLEKGADVNAKDSDGWTALMWASRNGHAETVTILLEEGADVNAKDNYFLGSTALDIAIKKEHPEIVKLLKQSIVTQTLPKHLERQEDRKNLAMVMNEKDVGNRGDGTMPYELRHEIGKYLGGGKRKTRKSKKSNKMFRTTRKKK
jgi:uncharacterized protein